MGTERQPCKDCPDRTITCHYKDHCKKYQRFVEYRTKINKAKRRENDILDYNFKAAAHSPGRERYF